MQLPAWLASLRLDPSTIVYAILVGVVMPWGAVRTTRRVGRVAEANRSGLYRRIVLSQLFLLGVALFVALTHGINLFALPSAGGGPTVAWSVAGLAAIVGALRLSWHTRSAEDKRSMWVRGFLPSNDQLGMWIMLALVAGVAEEACYRGLLFGIIATASGSVALGVVTSALVFGAGHHIQGLRSQVTIGVVALMLQGIVLATGSLIPAMVVHTIANIVAGTRGAARFRELEESVPA